MIVIANSTPLIYCATLSDLLLLRQLFGTNTIPQEVYREVVVEGKGQSGEREIRNATWIQVKQVKNQKAVERFIVSHRLHKGESETMVLYQQLNAHLTLLDEERAVAYARRLGMNVLRTAGVYMEAKRLGLIPWVREKLDRLRQEGFWLKDEDYEAIIRQAGEE